MPSARTMHCGVVEVPLIEHMASIGFAPLVTMSLIAAVLWAVHPAITATMETTAIAPARHTFVQNWFSSICFFPLLKNRERRLPAIGKNERGVVDALGIQIDSVSLLLCRELSKIHEFPHDFYGRPPWLFSVANEVRANQFVSFLA